MIGTKQALQGVGAVHRAKEVCRYEVLPLEGMLNMLPPLTEEQSFSFYEWVVKQYHSPDSMLLY